MEKLRSIKKADLEKFIIEYLCNLGYFATKDAFTVNITTLYVEYFVDTQKIPSLSDEEIVDVYSGTVNEKLSELTGGELSKYYYSFWESYEKSGNEYFGVRFAHFYDIVS